MKDQRLVPGLIGMSVHTDCIYQQVLHTATARPGPNGRPVNRLKALLYAIDFATLVDNIRAAEWFRAEEQIAEAAAALKAGGADFLVIAANTGNALAGRARDKVGLPILDITAPVCSAIRAAGHRTAGLLSTTKTDQSRVYQTRAAAHGLTVVSPSPAIARDVEALIFGELISGHFSQAGLHLVKSAASWFATQGADSVILGCTDLTHFVAPLEGKTEVPLFDSTRLHAQAAAQAALSGEISGMCAESSRPKAIVPLIVPLGVQ